LIIVPNTSLSVDVGDEFNAPCDKSDD